jgi:hypothetical protein
VAGAIEAEPPLPAFGEAEPGTPLAERDSRYAAGMAERKAARAAKTKALMATGPAFLRAINRGELDPRSIKPDPPRWSKPRPVPAEEPEDRGGLDWARWNAARNPLSREDFEREVAAVKADHWRRLSTGPERRVIAVSRQVPCSTVAVRRARPQGRNERRPGRRRHAASRAGPDGEDPDPAGGRAHHPDLAGSVA